MTYRTGNHWGVTIVRENDAPSASGYVCDGCGGQAEVWIDDRPLCRREPEVRAEAQLVAVVVNGDQALAARICALLTIDERCWHGEHCPGSGPDCERDAPLKGGHRDCADAWHAEHGCCTEPYGMAGTPADPAGQPDTTVVDCRCLNCRSLRGDAPSRRAISPQAAQNGLGVPAPTLGHLSATEALRRQMLAWVEMIEEDVDWSRGDINRALGEMRRAAAGLSQQHLRCICNDPPPTVDKPKNGTASRPDGWACPRHGTVI